MRQKTGVTTNETNLAAVLVRCQTKGMVYVSGNTKIVQQRNSLRAGSRHTSRALESQQVPHSCFP